MNGAHRARRRAPCLLLALLLGAGCAELFPGLHGAGGTGRVVGRLEPGSDVGTVIVYLESAQQEVPTPGAAIATPVEVTIRDGAQDPSLPLVHPGQALRIDNRDPIHHELFSVGSRNRLALRVAGGSRSSPVRLEHRELVRAFCRLHPSEDFAFLVSSAEHHTRAAEDATFAIPDVTPGAYRLWAASRSGRSAGALLRVEAGRTTVQDVRLEAGRTSVQDVRLEAGRTSVRGVRLETGRTRGQDLSLEARPGR